MKTTYKAGRYYILNGDTGIITSHILTSNQVRVLFQLIGVVCDGLAHEDYYTEGVTFDN